MSDKDFNRLIRNYVLYALGLSAALLGVVYCVNGAAGGGDVPAKSARPAPRPFPLGKDWGGAIGWGDKSGVRVSSRVERADDGRYVYTYRLVSKPGSPDYLVSWACLDYACGIGGGGNLYLLKPGKELKVVVRHKDAPVFAEGPLTKLRVCRRRSPPNETDYRRLGVEMPASEGGWYFWGGMGMPGPLPKSYVERWRNR